MEYIDAQQILDNRLFQKLVAQRKEMALTNFMGADLENDRVRLSSAIQLQLLSDIVEELEEKCKVHEE